MTSNPPLSRGSSSGPRIRKTHNIKITAEEEAVLRNMFNKFDLVAIEAEFGRGFSGSRVFRVRLTETGGKARLPAVVKIAPIDLIHKERQAYETWVEHTLPKVVRLEITSNLPANSLLGGLCYSLVGSGAFKVQSLADYYREYSIDDLCWVLENRLFKILGPHWWLNHHVDYSFQMQTDYDTWLPVNLTLKPINSPSDEAPLIRLDNSNLPPPVIETGEQVELKGFRITQVNPDEREVTLNLPQPLEEQSTASYRVRLVDVPDVADYPVDKMVDSIYGQVTATRHDLLVGLAGQVLGAAVDLSAKQLTLPGNLSLPNPLLPHQDLLWDFLTANISTVHGDLNLENVMVDPETREVKLIDFATAHQGHALSDLLRLEVEVVVMLIPPVLGEADLPPETIYTLYEQLHRSNLYPDQVDLPELPHAALEKPFKMLQTIRKMARICLFAPNDWGEYYRGLTLYLLGTLKFKVLSQVSKQTAFWGAATVQRLLEISSSSAKETSEPRPPRPATPPELSPVVEPPFGMMPLDSKLYIKRAADDVCREQLGQDYAVTLFIQSPWQMGKSSLMGRAIDQAHKKHGKISVFINFQKFPTQYFEDEDQFLKGLCLMIGDALGISQAIDQYWLGLQTSIVKCSHYLSDYIIPQIDAPLILAMDEVERMLTSPFRVDFFGMLRTWHNERFFDESLARMSLFLSSSTDPYLLIDDPNQSPFNVAEVILLQDFTRPEVEELNRRHGSPLRPGQIDDLMDLIGGHPFLTRLALYRLVKDKIDLDTLLVRATEDTGPFGAHLRHYYRRVLAQPEVKQALANILYHQTYEKNQIFYRLNEAGLIKKVGQKIVLRNKLYTRYFEERLHGKRG